MKNYKITFTADYTEYEEWAKEDNYWAEKIRENPKQLAMCKKWKDKTTTLEDLPELVKEVGQVVLSEDEVEIYNDYRE